MMGAFLMSKRSSTSLEIKLQVVQRCIAHTSNPTYESKQPGVYSARYAGEEKDANKNMDLVLNKLSNSANRKAHFKTVIALNINNEQHLFTGIVEGNIRKEKFGTGGFGYDPIFEPENTGKTFAEMSLEDKNKMSHRGRAVTQLIAYLSEIENK